MVETREIRAGPREVRPGTHAHTQGGDVDSAGRSPVLHVVAGVGTSSALQPHHAGPIPGWGHLPTSNYPRAPS